MGYWDRTVNTATATNRPQNRRIKRRHPRTIWSGQWIRECPGWKRHITETSGQNSKWWNSPAFVVFLSCRAVAAVEELLDLRYLWQPYLLCHRTKPTEIFSENTLNCGLKRMCYLGRLTGYGIGATISTALNELAYPKEWREARLSHSAINPVTAAYNNAGM